MITQERLKDLLNYDPETGIFMWKVRRHGVTLGSVAGCTDEGYIRIKIDGRLYAAHRLAWLYVNGSLPEFTIDHINRVRSDNRIANLRSATNAENHQNRSKYITNTSGVTGVYWDNQRGKWRAQIEHLGRNVNLGRYSTIEAAAEARAAAKKKFHIFNPEDAT
jgi:hypothetical protein